MEDYTQRRDAQLAPPRRDDDERDALARAAHGWLVEHRRTRRWAIFFRFVWLLVIVVALGALIGRVGGLASVEGAARHTALIEISGVIDAKGEASAEGIVDALQTAFKDSKTAGVVLRINSPGGSPVQAGIIHDEIRRLRAKYPNTPLYAVVEDLCASGGYYVASAADRIYVDKASLVGSIGVLMDGFGFVGAMDKLGIERRLLTAGENKGFLDSFSPVVESQRKYAMSMIEEIHRQFIDVVRKGRGERLKDSPELYSGLIWTGARSVELGLADDFGTTQSVARDVIKAEEVVDYSPRQNVAERLAKRLGAAAGETVLRQITSGALGGLQLR